MGFEKRYFTRKPADTKNDTVKELIERIQAFTEKFGKYPATRIVLMEYFSEQELEEFKRIDSSGFLFVGKDKEMNDSPVFGIRQFGEHTTLAVYLDELIEAQPAKELLTVMLEQLDGRMKKK